MTMIRPFLLYEKNNVYRELSMEASITESRSSVSLWQDRSLSDIFYSLI